MRRVRTAFLALACASLLALTACGDEKPTTDASPSATVPSASSAPPAEAPPSSAPSTAAASDVVSDKELCRTAKQAAEEMKKNLTAALKSGTDTSPALFQKILSGLQNEVIRVAATGATGSKVVAALERFAAEAGKAANAEDPATAADNPAFAKAGRSVTTACKSAGVDVIF